MLYEKLREYSSSGVYPMHMPGHKRKTKHTSEDLPYSIDITEIDGFDNLQDPKGILLEIGELAAQIYGSDKTYPLINGSTAGILAAIGAHSQQGDKILIARNTHLSVYNAVELFGLKPIYVMPETDKASGIPGSIDPKTIETQLEKHPEINLVVITSPTYEGIVSDIRAIAETAHRKNAVLLVDSAHGAHLGFSPGFPENAVKLGADIVVMSLHKTLPALTQCALLHVSGNLANRTRIARSLTMFQTSSPSYVLMASIDNCLQMLRSEKDALFRDYENNLAIFSEKCKQLRNLIILCQANDIEHNSFFAFDPGKIVIITKYSGISGIELMEVLRKEYQIELEMALPDYAIAMTSVFDTTDGFSRLADALISIDSNLVGAVAYDDTTTIDFSIPYQYELPGVAISREGKFMPLIDAVDMMSLEYVWVYPPGVPIIVPGEIVDMLLIERIEHLVRCGIVPISTHGLLPELIYVYDVTIQLPK